MSREGKCLKKAEREEKLRQKLIEMSEFEKNAYAEGFSFIAGVDEVGRGPLAGPVVAATVVLSKDFNILGVNDSKKVSQKKREELFDAISGEALAIGISFVDNNTIDEINILQATKLAMEDSFLKASKQCKIDILLTDAVKLDNVKIKQQNIIKGDEKSVTIAAASIIAKVTRDRFMEEMDIKYPGYEFASNKGYGTKKHYEGLDALGITPIHRKTFVKKYCK